MQTLEGHVSEAVNETKLKNKKEVINTIVNIIERAYPENTEIFFNSYMIYSSDNIIYLCKVVANNNIRYYLFTIIYNNLAVGIMNYDSEFIHYILQLKHIINPEEIFLHLDIIRTN